MALKCSVVIPVRNMARYLAEAVESVLAQDARIEDVIIVNDGSTDGTAEVARRYASKKVRIIDEGRIGSAGGTRNRGLRECKGDAVIFLDADDRLLPGAIERFLRRLERDPGFAVAYGEVRVIDEEGRPLGTGRPPIFTRRRPSGDALPRLLRGTPVVAPGAACIRLDNLRRAGPFTSLPVGEDWELYVRVATTGRFSYLRGDPVLEYRRHGASMTATRAESVEAVFPTIEAIYGNPAIQARFRPWFLASQRRRCVAGAYAHAGRVALRNRNWGAAGRNLFECLRRDPWRPREAVFLLAALARWLPGPLKRRIK